MLSSGEKGGMAGGKKRGTERWRQGGSATCVLGQIRVGTCFALNDDEETVDNEAALTTRGARFIPL